MKTEETENKPKTRQEMRLAIAKDVIKSLDAGLIDATAGTYYRGPLLQAGREAQSVLLSTKAPCEVCALGAAFVSCVRVDNKYDKGAPCSSLMVERLSEYFHRWELDLFEDLFEDFVGPVLSGRIQEFLGLSDGGRMRVLFQTFIDNGGEMIDIDSFADKVEKAAVVYTE